MTNATPIITTDTLSTKSSKKCENNIIQCVRKLGKSLFSKVIFNIQFMAVKISILMFLHL